MSVSTQTTYDEKTVATRRTVLVGHPNVGKSVLFHALTGRYVAVSNYPGTTVDVAHGVGRLGSTLYDVIDSPGVHSLSVHSDEEQVTRTLLLGHPDCLIQVGVTQHLTRVLALTLELAELELPMVLCLNMRDESEGRGFHVDVQGLSHLLGIPVVETSATLGDGIEDLRRAVEHARPCLRRAAYTSEVSRALSKLTLELSPAYEYLAPLILQNKLRLDELAALGLPANHPALHLAEEIRQDFVRPLPIVLTECRQAIALEWTGQYLRKPDIGPGKSIRSRWLDTFGRWCLQSWPGYPIAAAVLTLVYLFVGYFGAKVLVDFLEQHVFGQVLNPIVTQLVSKTIPWGFLRDLLVGPYGIITMALTYAFALILPIVSCFFLALGILEDSGYLPRLSVLLDKVFRLMGLNGKAVFPMILGLGCGTMAMLTTRILETKKERALVSFLLALAVPCSAQLGVVMAMTAGLSLKVTFIWLGITIGSLLGVGGLASWVMPGNTSMFLLEIPPLRWPQPRNLWKKVETRLVWYLKEVVPLFVLGTVILFLVDRVGYLQRLETFSSPLITRWLGLPSKATEAFLLGFLRRDYGAAGLFLMQRNHLLSMRQVAVSVVAITLFMPCMAQWLMSLKERGWKFTFVISILVSAYALLVSGGLNWMLLKAGWI